MSLSAEQWPEAPEVDRVYFFVRKIGEELQLVNFMRYSDGSAGLMGALVYGCEGHAEAWRSGLSILLREGYRFHSAGKVYHMDDFITDRSNPLPGGREWARAIRDARPQSW